MHRKFIPAYLLTLVNVLGFSILMPVLPFVVVDHYGAPKYVYGLLLSAYSFFQFLGAPYLGRLSDSVGRKPVLLISQAGTLLCWVIFGLSYFVPDYKIGIFALPLFVIALARILGGITGGNTSVAQAYVSDITTQEEKNYIFGYIGGIVGLGMIVGPAIGGISASTSWGYLGTVVCNAILSFVTLLTIYFWLEESLPLEKRKPRTSQSILSSFALIRRIKELESPVRIRKIFALRALFNITMATYVSTIALFIIDLFHFDEKKLGMFMLVVGLFISFNQAFVSKWWIGKVGTYRTLQWGMLLSVFGFVGITLTDNLWFYIALYYVLNLGIALCAPTLSALLAKHASPKEAGEVMGIAESIGSLSNVIFPLVGAAIYGVIGSQLYWGVAFLPLFGLFISYGADEAYTED